MPGQAYLRISPGKRYSSLKVDLIPKLSHQAAISGILEVNNQELIFKPLLLPRSQSPAKEIKKALLYLHENMPIRILRKASARPLETTPEPSSNGPGLYYTNSGKIAQIII
ncbi:MAG TPA: hypothetical protein V6C96_02450 [Vampirovibrionales bacterium]